MHISNQSCDWFCQTSMGTFLHSIFSSNIVEHLHGDFFQCFSSNVVENLHGDTRRRDLGQSDPSVSFSSGDYWKSTFLLLYLYLYFVCICIWYVHLWSISDRPSLVGTLKQYKVLFQLHIWTEIIFSCFYTIYCRYTTYNPNGQANEVKIVFSKYTWNNLLLLCSVGYFEVFLLKN